MRHGRKGMKVLFSSLGAPELLIILAVVVLIFGAGKLSGVGGALGRSIREFKEEREKEPKKVSKPEQQESPVLKSGEVESSEKAAK